jgi:Patatin-like phospholipase
VTNRRAPALSPCAGAFLGGQLPRYIGHPALRRRTCPTQTIGAIWRRQHDGRHIGHSSAPPFECIARLLQGCGALGAYQAGVYQAQSEAHLPLDWIAGISIGATTAALIAGNPPQARVEKLRKFWELVTTPPFALWGGIGPQAPALYEETLRRLMSPATAAATSISSSTLDRDSAKPNAARADDRHGFRESVDGGASSASRRISGSSRHAGMGRARSRTS